MKASLVTYNYGLKNNIFDISTNNNARKFNYLRKILKENNFLLNEEVNNCLNKIIQNKSFSNGYIFYGAAGVGKRQTDIKFIK